MNDMERHMLCLAELSVENVGIGLDRHLFLAAMNALRSYQHGNKSPELAKRVADQIQERLEDEI